MKERLRHLMINIEQKTERFLRLALDTPASYELVIGSFQHGKGCSTTKPLRKIERFQNITYSDGRISNFPVGINYVECPECHNSERYSG